MISWLSTASRIVCLQTGIILSMILFSAATLRITGHGRHAANNDVAGKPDYRPPQLAAWFRDEGWTLLAFPVALAVYAIRLKRRLGSEHESVVFPILVLIVTVGLFCFGLVAGLQPLRFFGF